MKDLNFESRDAWQRWGDWRLIFCIKGRRPTITSLIEQPFVESDVGYRRPHDQHKIVFGSRRRHRLATGASALPLNPIHNNSVDQVRTVCDERTLLEETNPADGLFRQP
jgi:hypothetical protein